MQLVKCTILYINKNTVPVIKLALYFYCKEQPGKNREKRGKYECLGVRILGVISKNKKYENMLAALDACKKA